MKLALRTFVVFVASASCVSAQGKQGLSQLLKRKGYPAFTATSVDVRGHLMACRGLELFDPNAKPIDALPGRVVLYCDVCDSVWLWAAMADLHMKRAAPTAGRETPGAKLPDIVQRKLAEPSKLANPARVWLGYIDKDGVERLTVEITVDELASKD